MFSTNLEFHLKTLARVWSWILLNPSGPPFYLYCCCPLCLLPVFFPPDVLLLQMPWLPPQRLCLLLPYRTGQIFLVKQQGLLSTFVSLQLSPLWCQVCWQSLALCCHLLRRLKQTHCSDTPWHQLVRWATLNPWICKFYMVITIQDRRNQLEWTGRDSTKDAWGHLSHIFRCMNVLFVGQSNSLKHGLSWTLNTCTIHMRHQHIKCLEMDFFPWWNYQ